MITPLNHSIWGLFVNLSQLEIIHALVETGSLRGAAALVKKSQSALSVSIKNLENELGVKIMDRSEYRAKLTADGEVLFRQFSVILRATGTLKRLSSELHNKKSERKLTIAIDPLLPPEYLKAISSEARKVSSTTTLLFRYGLLTTVADDLAEGRISLAIAPDKFITPLFEALPIVRTSLVSVVSEKVFQEFNKNEDLVLSQVPQVLVYAETMDQRNKLQVAAIECHQIKGPQILVSDHSIKVALIKSGQGWGRVSIKDIKTSKDAKLVKLKSVPEGVIDLDLRLMRKIDRPLGPVARAIWRHFEEQIPSNLVAE